MSAQEEWRPVVGYEGFYSVSSLGRVRSEERYVRHNLGGLSLKKQRVRKQSVDADGYCSVVLSHGGKNRGFRVAALVLGAFVGPRPDGYMACHNNGVRDDNRPENLRWDTIEGNFADKRLHGTAPLGEKNARAKLTDGDVLAIRSSGMSGERLAKVYGISATHARRVRDGEVWRHL